MSAPKPWFASTTIISTLLAAIGGLIVVINTARPGTVPDEVTDAVNHPDAAANIAQWVGGLLWFLGFVGAIVGRVRAKDPISKSVVGKKAPMLLLAVTMGVGVPAAVVTMPGCTLFQSDGDALKDYDRANEVYIAALDIAIAARTAGKIDAAAWSDTFLPLIERGDRLLDDFEAAARLDDATAIDRLGALLDAITRELTIETARVGG